MSKNVKTFSEAFRNGMANVKETKSGVFLEANEEIIREVKQCLVSGDVSRIEWHEDHCMFTLRYEPNENGINRVVVRFDTGTALKILYRVPIVPFRFFIEECNEAEFPNIWMQDEKGGEA